MKFILFCLVTSFLNFSVRTELTHNKGRLDLLIETENFLYLMEFKMGEEQEKAIAQIKKREYAQPYIGHDKSVYLVGISFSKKERNIDGWAAEEMERK